MTKSIGNFSGRPWVLKKWTVKMKPVASKRLIRVNDGRHVECPAREEQPEELREPEHQAGTADGKHTPEDGDEVEFLPVGPALEGRLRSLEEEPATMPVHVLDIAQVRAERIRPEQALEKVALDILPEEKEVDAHHQGRAEVDEGDHRAERGAAGRHWRPRRRTSSCTVAQGWSPNLSGRPVRESSRKLVMTRMCRKMCTLLKRRYCLWASGMT